MKLRTFAVMYLRLVYAANKVARGVSKPGRTCFSAPLRKSPATSQSGR